MGTLLLFICEVIGRMVSRCQKHAGQNSADPPTILSASTTSSNWPLYVLPNMTTRPIVFSSMYLRASSGFMTCTRARVHDVHKGKLSLAAIYNRTRHTATHAAPQEGEPLDLELDMSDASIVRGESPGERVQLLDYV